MTKIIQGDKFMCRKHDLDYRITCEECQEKFKFFQKAITKTRKTYDKN